MNKIDHIAIVTGNIEGTIRLYEKIVGIIITPPVSVPDQGILSAVVPMENVEIEILQPTDPEGGIQKYLDKKGTGIHHIALCVEDRDVAIEKLTAEGIKLIIGTANGKPSVFIHPKSAGGVLIELSERKVEK